MMAGTGVLRPECAAVLVKPTANNWIITTETAEATYAAATTTTNIADANFFVGPTSFSTVTGMAIATYLRGAGAGGVAAAKARHGLRCNLGSNFSREVLNTASGAFPYA
jgi:hypothetical protein